MKKAAASKSRSRTTKKTATSRVSTAKQKPITKLSWVDNYYRQTDEFFLAHPNARVLIGIFIVVYVMFLGLYFHDKAQVMGWTTVTY